MKDKPENITEAIRQPAYIVRAVRGPIQSFIHTEEVGALFLLGAAALAMAWVNSPWSESYFNFWHIDVSFDIHIFAISKDLRHLVNDGLMAIFFFVVGLEIKRELLHGELSTVRKAALPAIAAVGGMAMPAAVYLLFNGLDETAVGWGIPMATDIAFALGVLALLGKRIPTELRVFLLGVAVVDDVGAITVIAVFYTDSIHWLELGLGIAVFAAIALCVRVGIRSLGFYLMMCFLLWLLFLESGVHATLTGVLVAAIVPSRPDIRSKDYAAAVESLLHDYKVAKANDDDDRAEMIVEQVEKLSSGAEGPLERLSSIVHPWVSFAVLPIFALANAGIVFNMDILAGAVASPVTLGVAMALLVGNPIGIFGLTWLAVRLGVGQLPASVTLWHVLSVGFLAGIGFTVSIFVSGIAFDDTQLVDEAKIGIFGASLIAGIVGYLMLRFVGATKLP